MKKFLVITFCLSAIVSSFAQNKGVKIGYIDMDYILENVPDYKEAITQLEQKAQKWKQDIEVKKNEINRLNNVLKIERALLTKELIEEKESEIKFQEKDLIDYQQKRFGTNGDYIIQKTGIAKPVQDQVFTAVQDIAEAKAFDFIFDKSSDLTMLFSAKKYDISDRIIKVIVGAEKREQISKKQLKAIEEKEAKEEKIEDNPNLIARQKLLNEKKAIREKLAEEKKQNAIEKRKEFEERRAKLKESKTNVNNGTNIDSTSVKKPINTNASKVEAKKRMLDSIKSSKEAERKKALDVRKKALEEKKKKITESKK